MAVYRNKNYAYGIGDNLIEMAPEPIVSKRAPSTYDRVSIGTMWIHTTLDDVYVLTSIVGGSATWINTGGGSGTFATVTSTGDITSSTGDITATAGAVVAGTTVTATTGLTVSSLTEGVVQSNASGVFSSSTGNDGQILIDSTAGTPAWANITSTGGTMVITNGANTINIEASGATTSSYTTDVGGPVSPLAGVLDIDGGTNITTDGSVANRITFNLDDDVTLAGFLDATTSITAGIDFTMTSGDCSITGTSDSAQTIYLRANGGTSETIDIHSDQGTGVASIYMHSDVGGLTLESGLNTTDAININATAGGIDVDAAENINIQTTKNTADAIVMQATAGGIDITSNGGAGEDIDISSTGSSVNIVSAEDAAACIYLHANGGAAETLRLHSDQGTSATSIDLDSDVGGITLTSGLASDDAINLVATNGGVDVDAALQLNLTSSEAAADAVVIYASNAAGGIDCDYGTGGMTIDGADGDFTLQTGTGAINLGTDAASHVITIGNITTATQVDVNTGTGGFNVATTGTGDVTIDSDDTILIDADGVIEINSSGGAINIGNDADAQGVNIATGAAARDVVIGNTTAGSSVVIEGGSLGDILLTPASNSAAGAAITLNAKVGVVTLTGNTTASTATETFTITNSEVSATSGILVTVSNVGTNDARMTLEQVKPAAGSFEVKTQNNGAAALNGNVIISFIVLS